MFIKILLFLFVFCNISYSKTEQFNNVTNYNNEFYTKINVFPKVIAVDLCGTIIDSKKTDIKAINKTIKKYKDKNLEWNDIKHLKDPNKSMKENFINFFDKKNYKEAYKYYINNLINTINKVEIFDGVIDFFEFCKKHNIKLALITNRDKEYVDAFFKKNKNGKIISDYIEVVTTADSTGFTKPDYRILEKTLQKMNVKIKSHNEIFFIGDSLADLNLVANNKINGTFVLLNEIIDDIKNNNFQNLQKNILFFKNYNDFLKDLVRFFNMKIAYFVIMAAPGSGKSTINKKISDLYKKNIFDFDKYIDTIFTEELRKKINNENKYKDLKFNKLVTKINEIDFNNYIIDIRGGTAYCDERFIEFLKNKNIKIIYYDVPIEIIKNRFKNNEDEIKNRKMFSNKNKNWEDILQVYFDKCFELKKYADFYLKFDSYSNDTEIVNDITNFLLTN